jgi:GTP:adenosylcobinamide-phosphate guanylyltransferase
VMTITGDSFGYNTDVINVTYTDGTPCVVISADMTSITCENKRFTSGAASTQSVIITINGISDSSLSVVLLP